MKPIIYHNPRCSTSRNTLAMIKASGEEPTIIEYLKTSPTHEELQDIVKRLGVSPRAIIRRKEAVYKELGLDDESLSAEKLIDAMVANPILIERPIVITDKGVTLCRPAEQVLSFLKNPITKFTKENGDVVTWPKQA